MPLIEIPGDDRGNGVGAMLVKGIAENVSNYMPNSSLQIQET